MINTLSIYVDTKFNNERLFHGTSNMEKRIEKINVTSRDELIAKSILRAPKNSYILCAYGPLKTTMNSKEIFEALEFIVENQKQLDVFYLSIYSDNCSLRTDDFDYNNMTFTRTMSPHGTECILITPMGVEKILDLMQEDHGRGFDFYLNAAAEKMMIYTSIPSIVKVDVSRRTKDTQLIKAAECREEIIAVKPLDLTKKYTGNMNLFWFFLVIIFILFIAVMILTFNGKKVNVQYYQLTR